MSNGDPIPSSSITDATTGGLSVIVVTGGSTGDVLTKQSDGTYLPITPTSGGVSALGTTGTDLNISGSTLNVPNAGASARGVVSTGAQTFSGAKTFTTKITAPANAGNTGGIGNGDNGIDFFGGVLFYATGGKFPAYAVPAGFRIANDGLFLWSSGNGNAYASGSTGIGQPSAGLVEINNGTNGTQRDFKARDITATGLVCAGTYTVATLPSAAANSYKFATVSDSSVTTFGSTVAGGGSSKVMVYSNGSNWTVFAI